MKHLILLQVLLLAVSGIASSAEESRTVQFRTLCLEQIAGLEKVILPAGKDFSKNQEIALFTDLSPAVKGVFKNNEAVFYSLKPGADGKPVRVVVGKATLGKSSSQLFVFLPNGGGDDKPAYRVLAYDDDLKSFALGTIRAINLASAPLRFVMPDATVPPILPETSTQFPHSKKVNEYNLYSVSVEFQSASGEWVTAQSANWKTGDTKREIVIASENLATKVRTIQIFSDFPPKVTP